MSEEVNNLQPETGVIVPMNGESVAIYKDAQGKLHKFSALCTHEFCEIEWNAGDKVWDCPCHGSRFSADGQVLQGPAEEPLNRID